MTRCSQTNELSQEIDQYELNLANGIWVEQSAPISEAYLQTIQDTFGTGGAQQADFAGQPDVERQKINAWAAEQTRDRIPEVLPPGSVDPMTIAILANAIYFKGNWESPFDKERTKEAPFLQSGGRKNHVDLMNGMKSVGYAAFQADGTPFETPKMHSMDEEDSDPKFYPGQGGFQIAELAYRGDQISMVILLPTDVDGLAALEAKLNSESLSQWLDQVAKRKTQLSLPKFKMEGQYSLRDSLSALGMGTAFGSQADFSGITGADSPRLQLSDVHHATFIQVDEVGTEAAAVTAVGVAMTALPVQVPLNPIFRADHPFLFLIRDQVSGAILFLGRMMDPVGA